MKQTLPENIYFVGAGGIGMANLVRYCMAKGCRVAGYDLTPSALTDSLEAEGASLTFRDDVATIPPAFSSPENTLVVYTPAVPESNRILTHFRRGGFEVVKRAALLGKITRHSEGICVAGSHGKTTTCSMIANILRESAVGCNAFLGGILRNTGSNYVQSDSSRFSVIEADEYDRSFHHLSPHIAVVTSTDPDHLDIYGNEENYLESFAHFTSLVRPGGCLIVHKGLKLVPRPVEGVRTFSYSMRDGGDFHAENITVDNGRLHFDLAGPGIRYNRIELGLPVEINVDNAVAAAAASHLAGATEEDIRRGLSTFRGAKRRFEIHLNEPGKPVLIDDYAHSPNEIRSSIASVRKLFPGRTLTVVFQPHLYTRTRDFAHDFADALSGADEVILPEIYPARELPIPGVTSALIYNDLKISRRSLIERKDLVSLIKNRKFDVLMTLGAADIDRLLPDIKAELLKKSL